MEITGQRGLCIDISASLAVADKYCFVLAHFQRGCGTMLAEVKVDREESVFHCDSRSFWGAVLLILQDLYACTCSLVSHICNCLHNALISHANNSDCFLLI